MGGLQRTFSLPKIQRKGDRQSERIPAELTKELLSSISRALGACEGGSRLPRGPAFLSSQCGLLGTHPGKLAMSWDMSGVRQAQGPDWWWERAVGSSLIAVAWCTRSPSSPLLCLSLGEGQPRTPLGLVPTAVR